MAFVGCLLASCSGEPVERDASVGHDARVDVGRDAALPTDAGDLDADPDARLSSDACVDAAVLPGTGPGRFTVVVANLAEFLDSPDNAEPLDLDHFVSRLAAKTTEEIGRAPDVVLLQEVNAGSATYVAGALTRGFAQPYSVAAIPAPGEDAIVRPGIRGERATVMRETSVVINDTTMERTSPVTWIGFGYGRAAVAPGTLGGWTSLQAPLVRLRARETGDVFVAVSVHYVPESRLTSPAWYKGAWSDYAKQRIAETFPAAIPLLGGDLNHTACAMVGATVGDPACDGDPENEFHPMWIAFTQTPPVYHGVNGRGIDHFFSPAQIVAHGSDDDYKRYGPDDPTRFATRDDVVLCDDLYKRGLGDSDRARAINGCFQRYYSDHAFQWAVVDPAP